MQFLLIDEFFKLVKHENNNKNYFFLMKSKTQNHNTKDLINFN